MSWPWARLLFWRGTHGHGRVGAHGMGATWFYRGRRIVESVYRAGSLVVLNLLTVADETMSEDVSLFCIAGSKN